MTPTHGPATLRTVQSPMPPHRIGQSGAVGLGKAPRGIGQHGPSRGWPGIDRSSGLQANTGIPGNPQNDALPGGAVAGDFRVAGFAKPRF